eukprot:403352804
MGDLGTYRERAKVYGELAAKADNEKRFQDAYDNYVKAVEVFQYIIKYDQNKNLQEVYKRKCIEYLDRAQQLKEYLNKLKEGESMNQGGGSAAAQRKKDAGHTNEDEENKLQDALSSAIVREKPNVKWTDVAGLDQAKSSLQEAVILPTKFPQLFTGERKPWRGILLYGPPGTGKSYLAKACATEADGTFFSISSSDLVSKWLGESERLVKQLFKLARENKPAIIFIDEIDSLCGSRSEGENETSRRIKTEFLVQMQGVGNDNDGILVLGASNVPWELDPAIRRRFEKRIYIPLPDIQARLTQFKIRIGQTPNNLTEDDYLELGRATEGYSGSDITVVVKEALMFPIRKCQTAQKFKKTFDGFMIPTYPSDPEGIEMTIMQLEPRLLKAPDVTTDDFFQALARIRPSVAQKDLDRQIEFTSSFGQDG